MNAAYIELSSAHIAQLVAQGCSCDDWSTVKVVPQFTPDRIWDTKFTGINYLGYFEKAFTFFGGVIRKSGIRNAHLHNCTIGNNVFIESVRSYIANYILGDEVIIENADIIAVEGPTSFGNGIEISVMIESGGREIPIFDKLSAHIAYIICFYRHRPRVISYVRKIVDSYTSSVTSSVGTIGEQVRIQNCRSIKNVKIGPYSVIEGSDKLENGSINSCEHAPVIISTNVKAYNFIICSGARVTDGVILSDSFVGQGCVLGKHYSAESSIFFANCGGYHGEASSIFAGPYTVSFHKSTLLISGFFSFLNAGSGSNQSNHMYKLGPIHQGVLERGAKTTSDSYLSWPAKVGAFTLVYGRHYRNSDTSNLPFSYLIENENESILVPGVNLRSVGTIRDAIKWPKRDRRKDPNLLDYINFNLLSPYTIHKMIQGIEILTQLKKMSGENTEYYTFNNVKIKKSSLNNGIELYSLAITKFLGNALIKRLEKKVFASDQDIVAALQTNTQYGSGKWIDLSGLFAPESLVEQVLDDLEHQRIVTIDQLQAKFKSLHENYYDYGWVWVVDTMQKHLNKKVEHITVDDITTLVLQWKKAVLELDDRLLADAEKEFCLSAQISFGIDGDHSIRQCDFENVRGLFEENDLVLVINKHKKAKSDLADELLERLRLVK